MRDRFITVICHTVRVGPATPMDLGTIITHLIISHRTTTRPLGRLASDGIAHIGVSDFIQGSTLTIGPIIHTAMDGAWDTTPGLTIGITDQVGTIVRTHKSSMLILIASTATVAAAQVSTAVLATTVAHVDTMGMVLE